MKKGEVTLNTTQDYATAFGVETEIAQILRYYQGLFGPQLYYENGVFYEGLVGGRMYMSTQEAINKAIKGLSNYVATLEKVLSCDKGNPVIENFIFINNDLISTLSEKSSQLTKVG